MIAVLATIVFNILHDYHEMSKVSDENANVFETLWTRSLRLSSKKFSAISNGIQIKKGGPKTSKKIIGYVF